MYRAGAYLAVGFDEGGDIFRLFRTDSFTQKY